MRNESGRRWKGVHAEPALRSTRRKPCNTIRKGEGSNLTEIKAKGVKKRSMPTNPIVAKREHFHQRESKKFRKGGEK